MNILKISFIILGFLMISVSCQKDQTPISVKSEDDQKDNNALSYDYPNKIGSWWTYSVYDSLQGQFDTVNVSIIDTTQ
ncbi:hypothetical protein GWN91_04975, partial [Candidatus Saccharibacteria bacterium]|nr:hypothetical protein [Candidatus Saccharibacteria bacterium]NIV04148.1 hypothetical protein [Calditrichia bacterium]NIV72506.1 hypothetical protein [Calditrichia bacterium]NIW80896.1 hypothetical protein [Calditrichia bacterium]